MFKKFNKSRGAVSGIIFVLGAILLLVIIVIFVVIKIGSSKTVNTANTAATANTVTPNAPPVPVYETQLGDITFVVEAVTNLGSVLVNAKDPRPEKNVVTTEKFIQVIVGAQNLGKANTNHDAWGIGNIVDSEGRNFVSINDKVGFYLPQPNMCGWAMKPAFALLPCVKIYEVSKQSTGLTVEVYSNLAKKNAFLDLNVQ